MFGRDNSGWRHWPFPPLPEKNGPLLFSEVSFFQMLKRKTCKTLSLNLLKFYDNVQLQFEARIVPDFALYNSIAIIGVR